MRIREWLHSKALFRSLFALVGFGLLLGVFLIGVQMGSTGEGAGAAQPGGGDATSTVYTCSMHPQIKAPEPGTCPICSMALISLDGSSERLSGRNTLELGEAAAALAQVRTARVERRFPQLQLRLMGEVHFDETRRSTIAAYFPGRLERLYVDSTGVPVKKGDHLGEIFSPELLAAQEELRQAAVAVKTQTGESKTMRALTEATYVAAREKLRLWGLSETQIDDVAAADEAVERLTIFSPMEGVVIERLAKPGDYVERGQAIYAVADLSHLWVMLHAYESQLPWLHYGQRVTFTTDAMPGLEFAGRISLIDPVLSTETRTVNVRVHVENENGRLKPGMFVRGEVDVRVGSDGAVMDEDLSGKWVSPMHPEIVKSGPGQCDVCGMALVRAEELGFATSSSASRAPLVIPATAPLITGRRAIVYVKRSGTEADQFEGREVRLGTKAGDFYVVLDGLQEGEEVVSQGAFKIDSAMQIESKPSMMSPEPSAQAIAPRERPTKGAATTLTPLAELQPWLDKSWSFYPEAQRALASDDVTGFRRAASSGLAALADAPANGQAELARLQTAHSTVLQLEIDAARELFEDWSTLLIRAAANEGLTPTSGPWVVAFCPMAFANRGAEWIQQGSEIDNPYFGSMMLRCGEVRRDLFEETRE